MVIGVFFMKIDTYNTQGKKAGKAELPDRIFGVAWKPALVKQVYDAEKANKRRPWAHTKNRGEVSGGGKKPWRQKGTGRARHGSTRSPLWVGGGVSHGPRNERSYEVKINKKMKRGAFFSVLSRKLKDNEVVLMDSFLPTTAKTKESVAIFKNLRETGNIYRIGAKGGRAIVAVPQNDSVQRSVNNLEYIKYIEPRNLNTSTLLDSKYVLFDINSISELTKTYANS